MACAFLDTPPGDAGLVALLERFAEAWNRHDLDALVAMMTDDCVFEASSGPQVDGQRSDGKPAVRAAYAAVFEAFPDAHWAKPVHFVAGSRGVSGEWAPFDRDPARTKSLQATQSAVAGTGLSSRRAAGRQRAVTGTTTSPPRRRESPSRTPFGSGRRFDVVGTKSRRGNGNTGASGWPPALLRAFPERFLEQADASAA